MNVSQDGVITNESVDDLPGAITTSPDLRKLRDRRARFARTRLARLFDYLVVPAEVPDQFNQPLAELRDRLRTADRGTASSVLAEAQALSDEAHERIESAERRATSLQGTVAIAASLVVAGAGLLLDDGKVASNGWRIALVMTLAGFLACLVACAWRALAVTGRMFRFEQPGTERIELRAVMSYADATALRSAELLRAGAVASEIGSVKVGLLKSAAWWLRSALLVLGLFVGLLCAYVIARPPAVSEKPTGADSTVTVLKTVTVATPETGNSRSPKRLPDKAPHRNTATAP